MGDTLYRIDPLAITNQESGHIIALQGNTYLGVLVPVEPERNEVWLSDPFGAYLVVDIASLAVDTVTDVRRKVYLGAAIGCGDDG